MSPLGCSMKSSRMKGPPNYSRLLGNFKFLKFLFRPTSISLPLDPLLPSVAIGGLVLLAGPGQESEPG